METLRDIAGATTLAFLLTAIFKYMMPAASSKAIGLFAVVSGQIAAVALMASRGELVLSQQVVAILFITGIFATASAMGIRQADSIADQRTTDPARVADIQAKAANTGGA